MVSFRIDENILHIIGNIAIDAGNSFQHILQETHFKHAAILDLSLVDKWDSSSIQLLLAYRKKNEDNPPTFRGIPAQMKDDLALMGLTTLFVEDKHEENSPNR
ncbi:anti-sigma factor antagonist [bacterium]|nr:anti-sigma factor antagonist [bacterium]